MGFLVILPFIIIPALIAFIAGYFTSKFVRKKLLSENNKFAVEISGFICLGVSLLVFSAIIILILSNIRLER